MDLKGNKGEWSELYTTLKLLADGKIYAADDKMEKVESLVYPILKILREEKEKSRNYSINGNIQITDPITNTLLCEVSKSDFLEAAQIVFTNITKLKGRSINLNRFDQKDALVEFLKKIDISALKAKSTDKSDIIIQIHDQTTGSTPTLGFSIKSMIGHKSTLFNPGAGTNFIFEVTGINNLPSFNINKFNQDTYNSKSKIKNRISKIEELGCNLNFIGTQSDILELNLRLIDGDLPEILAHLLKYRFSTGTTKLTKLLDKLYEENPLGYNLQYNHPFYKYKIIKFLYDAALGMTSETIWNGEIKANGGVIIVKNDGDILAYHTYHKQKFEEYLLNSTFLEQPSTSEDKMNPGYPETKNKYPNKNIKEFQYGWLYQDGQQYYLKLNLQVRFIK